ncbi:hypothetical protein SAY87_011003 [Trapa incisa]|uniref:Pentatricopeptide repeat-containing protein n=1 Tax=Trapa incisa TaxID=236973 RepID=A0AAN7GIN3_9MYRT|nr:hypothetical protein SAY87_011003 [Trapa incisa]
MPSKDVVARTNMIGGYCQEGRLAEAREIFDEMPHRNVISWTAMITGYVQNQRVDIARKLFEVMPEKNEVSWTAMLMGYTHCGRMEDASKLFKVMPVKSIVACNAMILGLGQSGEVTRARSLFDWMREKDDGTWSAMIKVYERKSYELEALDLFAMMQKRGVRPNFPSLISILSVCASLATIDQGRQIHAQLVRSLYAIDVYVASVLITIYTLVTGYHSDPFKLYFFDIYSMEEWKFKIWFSSHLVKNVKGEPNQRKYFTVTKNEGIEDEDYNFQLQSLVEGKGLKMKITTFNFRAWWRVILRHQDVLQMKSRSSGQQKPNSSIELT